MKPAIIAARTAFDAGLTRYFTGKECGNGHISERMISNGSCVRCLAENRAVSRKDSYERTKIWRLNNPQSRATEAERYREKHPEKVKANKAVYRQSHLEEIRKQDREYKARMRSTNPEEERRRYEKWRNKKEAQLTEIAGRPRSEICEICLEKGNTVFDHCHAKGNFRGWICDRCNKVLGLMKDNAANLLKLALYLENDNGKIDHQSTQSTS